MTLDVIQHLDIRVLRGYNNRRLNIISLEVALQVERAYIVRVVVLLKLFITLTAV